ncbi:hypothetical protein ACXDI5_005244 [Klebsiella variicola]
MMKINCRDKYAKVLNEIIANGANRQAIFVLCQSMVDAYGRSGGSLAYELLNDALDLELPSDAENVVLDALDALSGQCSPVSLIGSGDYHRAAQAA